MISERTETQDREVSPSAPPRKAPTEAPPPPWKEPETEPEPGEPRPRRRRWLWVLAFLGVASVAWYFFAHRGGSDKANGTAAGNGGDKKQDHPVPVLAATAKTKDVGVYLTGLGTVVPLNTVSVKSRVDGQLLRIDFREGQIVRAGDLLAEIDPRPFQVQLMQAEGQKAKDEAALHNAQVDLQRYDVLYKQDSIAKQQLDTQAATVAQDQAVLKSDQAQIESARLNLTYSRVTAPTGGRVGLRQTDVGNIVHAADANGLVVITQLQPIDVLFTIPADQLPQVVPQVHAGKVLAVDAYDRDLKHKLATGQVLAVDNEIDQTTGTVRLKAVFPNGDEALFPSQFVNARLLVDVLRNAVTVPAAAIQRSPQATFVYAIKADQTVESRNVAVGLTEGDDTVIQQGLAAGERVVIDGVDKLRPGMKVDTSVPGAGRGNHGGAAPNAAPNGQAGTADGSGKGGGKGHRKAQAS
jgi:membrane fusion protein, multidrug efflux system